MRVRILSGYHQSNITKGTVGELSKIYEEIDEVKDADLQKCKLMVLQELSDTVGAISHYLDVHHPSISIYDLIEMAQITKRAFEHGDRK